MSDRHVTRTAARRGNGPAAARGGGAPGLRSGHAAVRPSGARGARRPAAGPRARTRRRSTRAGPTRDLAAHLVVRERRPDAAGGILLPPLRGYAERVRRRIAARPYAGAGGAGAPATGVEPGQQPADRRAGQHDGVLHPPRGRPPGRSRVAAARAAPGLQAHARGSGPRLLARLSLRRFPADLWCRRPGTARSPWARGGERLRLVGAPGELTLFLSGRQRVARVQLDGPVASARLLRNASLGM